MMLCLVTDRRRQAPVEQARQAAEAGIELIQIRERDLEAAELAALVTEVVGVTRHTATRVVVNERVDVALACGAAGVHLRGDSMPTARVRAIVPAGFIIGRSVHRPDEARAEGTGPDYLIAGPVFPTTSKPDGHAWLGKDGLAAFVTAARVPVLAIGGMSLDRVPAIAAAGAAGLAAISLFAGAGTALAEVAARVRDRFDSVRAAS
jgi:thiamine-phosphate pyrophosphorylase